MSTLSVTNIKSKDTNPVILQDLNGNQNVWATRAFVTFDASSGTPTILASGNILSVTDGGIGVFGINFKTPMPDANYAVGQAISRNDGNVTQNNEAQFAKVIQRSPNGFVISTAFHIANVQLLPQDPGYVALTITR